jgi:hypothetical protein
MLRGALRLAGACAGIDISVPFGVRPDASGRVAIARGPRGRPSPAAAICWE